MTDATLHSLEQALTLTPSRDGALDAVLHEDFSNAAISQPPTAGFPFGGLLAALCAGAMRQGLELKTPLRTLSVQYLASAAYGEPLTFVPRLLRGGRTVAYTAVEAGQAGRATHLATATWGRDQPGLIISPTLAPPPPRDSLDPKGTIGGPMSPLFARYVDYLFDGGPNILGGNEGREPVERLWMRIKGGRPLIEADLCYLLDALYPPSWTAFKRPPMMTTIDLRYDLFEAVTLETAPDGWLFFEFRVLMLDNGWTVDDATAWTADGRPLAASRQRRKLVADRYERKSA
jgi:acyl-CoA thioesterase